MNIIGVVADTILLINLESSLNDRQLRYSKELQFFNLECRLVDKIWIKYCWTTILRDMGVINFSYQYKYCFKANFKMFLWLTN